MTLGDVGIITLASDGVLPWFEAWSRSVRVACPELRVAVIPFDERIDGVAKLCRRYDFGILELDFPFFDKLGSDFFPGNPRAQHGFRKLAAFEGPFETFLFLDSDVVVLQDLHPVLSAFEATGAALAYFDEDVSKVYTDGPLRARLVREGKAPGFNTGAFLSRRRALPRQAMESHRAAALEVQHELVALWEQPFLNFCFDHGDEPAVDIRTILPWVGRTWAGFPDLAESENVARLLGRVGRPGVRTPFVHWAGRELKWVMPYGAIYRRHAPFSRKARLFVRQVRQGIARRLHLAP